MSAAVLRVAGVLAPALPLPGVAHVGCALADLIRGDARVAVVRRGSARVHFVATADRRSDCPSARSACRASAYVVSGDVVIAGHREGALTCTGFVAPGGRARTIGWLPTAALARVQPRPVTITSGSPARPSASTSTATAPKPARSR